VHTLNVPVTIVDLMADSGLAASKSEARRLINGGGVRVDGTKVEQYELTLEPGADAVVQVGKRKFLRVQ
jgi:tyrosyl-tRNA synthetase